MANMMLKYGPMLLKKLEYEKLLDVDTVTIEKPLNQKEGQQPARRILEGICEA